MRKVFGSFSSIGYNNKSISDFVMFVAPFGYRGKIRDMVATHLDQSTRDKCPQGLYHYYWFSSTQQTLYEGLHFSVPPFTLSIHTQLPCSSKSYIKCMAANNRPQQQVEPFFSCCFFVVLFLVVV